MSRKLFRQHGAGSMPNDDDRVPIREQLQTRVAAKATRILKDPNSSLAQRAMAASVFLPDPDMKPSREK